MCSPDAGNSHCCAHQGASSQLAAPAGGTSSHCATSGKSGVTPASCRGRHRGLSCSSEAVSQTTRRPLTLCCDWTAGPTHRHLHHVTGSNFCSSPSPAPPQVRPKTQIPDSLPHSPCQELQPLSLQRATAVVSPRSQGPTLPTANSTLSPDHQPNGQSDASTPLAPPHSASSRPDSGGPAQHASAGPGVAYAIIAASPATGNGVSAVSEAVKVRSSVRQAQLVSDLISGDHPLSVFLTR